jgi:hypothetical protein
MNMRLMHRLEFAERCLNLRVRQRIRYFDAPRPPNDDDCLTHDEIRAALGLKPIADVVDYIYYCLKPGEPPRLRYPERWGFPPRTTPLLSATLFGAA